MYVSPMEREHSLWSNGFCKFCDSRKPSLDTTQLERPTYCPTATRNSKESRHAKRPS